MANNLTPQEREALRVALEQERARLERSLSARAQAVRALSISQDEESGLGGQEADVASDLAEEEVNLGLEQADRARLLDVEDALERLRAGTYGVCERCGQPIAVERLRVHPWTRVCLACAQKAAGRQLRPVPSEESFP